MQTKTKRLTESAMLISMAVVLELVSKMIIPEMPFGGQVTMVSMLPIVLISYRHGVRWGLVSGFCYALIEMAIGTKTVAAAFQPGYFGDGTMIGNALLMCLLDYVLAYTLLGLGGCFRNRIRNRGIALMCGSLVALSARYLAHILSGFLLFSAGRNGSSPRRASPPGAQGLWSPCPRSCWAWPTPLSSTACT